MLKGISPERVKLAITSNERQSQSDDKKNPDRMRIMLRQKGDNVDKRMQAVQYVDSQLLLDQLSSCLGVETFFEGYQLGEDINDRTIVGIYFKKTLHRYIEVNKSSGIDVCRLEGSGLKGREGVRELDKERLYWVPSIPNFANIDAAIVVCNVLYTIQYTIDDSHTFNDDTFYQKVLVRFVVSLEVSNFKTTVKFECMWKDEVRVSTRSSGSGETICVTSDCVHVDMKTTESMKTSMDEVLSFLDL